MTNEEHRTKNDVEIDCSHNLAAPWLRFLFFLLLLPFFSQFLSMLNAGTPSSAPLHAYLYEKMTFETMATCPGEMMLTPEVTGSPRRAGSFRLK